MKEPLGRRACSPKPPAGGEGGNHILILGEENFKITMISRLLCNLKFWYLLALAQLVLWQLTNGGGGPYWFAELVLYLIFFLGLWLDSRYHFRGRLTLSRTKAVFLYFVIFLATAMIYELSLSPTVGSFSEYHPKPIPSFIIIFGLYLALALFNFFLIRRYHYTFNELYFSGGAASIWEGLLFTGVLTAVILSPMFFLAPLTFAYYMLVYGVIFCMPLVFIREELLWSPVETTISFWRKMLYALISTFFGLLAWLGWAKMAHILTSGFEKF